MDNNTTEKLMERVNKLMDKRYLKKKDVAEKLGMDYLAFWRRLKGKRGVNITFLSELAFVLGTSVSYLMGETDNPSIISEKIIKPTTTSKSFEKMEEQFAYWGGVLDKAREIAKNGDEQEINIIAPLLKLACDTLMSRMSSDNRECKETLSRISQTGMFTQSIHGGHHNNNEIKLK